MGSRLIVKVESGSSGTGNWEINLNLSKKSLFNVGIGSLFQVGAGSLLRWVGDDCKGGVGDH